MEQITCLVVCLLDIQMIYEAVHESSQLLFYSFAGIHILDGSAARPVHHGLCFCHHRVPFRAVPPAWTHVAVTTIQEASYKNLALLCCTSWHFVTR